MLVILCGVCLVQVGGYVRIPCMGHDVGHI